MRKITQYAVSILIMTFVLTPGSVYADVLELKDGNVLEGQYKGGTQGTLRFQSGGQLKVIPVKDIMALTFTGEATPAAPKVEPAIKAPAVSTSAKKSSVSKGPVNVPAGTALLVRTSEEIATHNMSEGDRFSARLESKLMAGSVMVAPAGTTVYGRVLKSKKGGIGARKAVLELTLTQIKIDGQIKSITTSVLRGEGASGGLGRKILKGAAIGGLADGSAGADDGARIGAGVGILAGGKHAGIKSGTLVEFTLKDSLSL